MLFRRPPLRGYSRRVIFQRNFARHFWNNTCVTPKIMWLPLITLWTVPAALVVLVWYRMARGSRSLRPAEWRILGGRSRIELTPWVALQFAVLGTIFFAAGLIEGLIVPNLGATWSVVVGFITGATAVLTMAIVIRLAARSQSHAARRCNETREPVFD